MFQARRLEWVAISSPGALPGPGIEPGFPCLLHWQADFLPLSRLGSPRSLAQGGNSENGVSTGDFSPPGAEETGPGRPFPGSCGQDFTEARGQQGEIRQPV